jgi:small conductance mechanosensitive channel
VIINISRQGSRRLDIELKFPYSTDSEKVKKVMLASVSKSSDILKTNPPAVGVSHLEADGFKVSVELWMEATRYNDAKFHLYQRVMEDLKEADIKLPGM